MSSHTGTDLQEAVLRECAAAHPFPWYPADYVQATGVPRDTLDTCLDQLRLAGLLRLTDWVQQRGQGYALTEHGEAVLHNRRQMAALRSGRPPDAPAPRPEPEPRGTPMARGEAVRAALTDDRKPVVTQWLLYLNIGVFLLGGALAVQQGRNLSQYLVGIFGDTRDVMGLWHDLGAVREPDLVAGQWWRLLTCCFVHFGGIHLAMNMYGLYVLGPMLEKMWGRWLYLLVYLVSGLVGSCAQFVLVQGPTQLAGASGALCGLLGSMFVWVQMNKAHLPPHVAASWTRSIITNVILIVILSTMSTVSWAGHLGGGVAGAVISLPLNYSRFDTGVRRWLGLLAALAVPLVALGLLSWKMPDLTAEVQARNDQKQRDPQEDPAAKQKGKAKQADPADAKPLSDPEKAVRDKFYPKFLKTDEVVRNTYQEFAKTFVANGPGELGAEKIQELKAEFTRARAKALALHSELKEEKIPSPRARQHMERLLKYAYEAEQYYDLLLRAMEPRRWIPGNVKLLKETWIAVENLREELGKSPFWREARLVPRAGERLWFAFDPVPPALRWGMGPMGLMGPMGRMGPIPH
jgi:membrane associated rhomboid family serine protease